MGYRVGKYRDRAVKLSKPIVARGDRVVNESILLPRFRFSGPLLALKYTDPPWNYPIKLEYLSKLVSTYMSKKNISRTCANKRVVLV